jgi:hypothetical protein
MKNWIAAFSQINHESNPIRLNSSFRSFLLAVAAINAAIHHNKAYLKAEFI